MNSSEPYANTISEERTIWTHHGSDWDNPACVDSGVASQGCTRFQYCSNDYGSWHYGPMMAVLTVDPVLVTFAAISGTLGGSHVNDSGF